MFLSPVDILSDVLRAVRLDGAFFYRVEATNPWCVQTSRARELTPRIMPSAEHLISYHILVAGSCYGGLADGQPVELAAGDVIVFPHGDAHTMSGHADRRGAPGAYAFAPPRYPEGFILGNSPHTASFVCGFLGCDLRPFNPLLAALPRQIHVRGLSTAWHGTFTSTVLAESRAMRPGAETVLTRMAELMFIEVLRRYADGLPPGQTGWLAGLRDEVVGKALGLLHARPGHAWTLVDLARETATSRTSLAKRFTDLVGQPPMQYLAQWRMQVAANLLAQGGAKVATIGQQVGYDSEAAFSRAFKKATGMSPKRWRDGRLGG